MIRVGLVSLVALAMLTSVAADEQVVLISFTHRHGARTPILDDPILAAQVCGAPGCGQLTHDGKMMLEALGNFVHDRYGKNINIGYDGTSYFTQSTSKASIVPANKDLLAFLADGNYHLNKQHTRSTQIDRTIQSADAVIRGIVQNQEKSTYPVVHTVDLNRDTLLLTDTALSMTIPFDIKKLDCVNDIDVSSFTTRFPGLTPSKLTDIANELGLGAHLPCSSLAEDGSSTASSSSTPIYDWMNCTLNLQDAAASFISMYADAATRFPKALAAFDELSDFLKMIRVCKYATTSPEQGYLSYKLVQKQVDDMSAFAQQWLAANGNAANLPSNQTTIAFHYSGHDTTIAPLAAALGHPDLLLPLFGQTIITELVFDQAKGTTNNLDAFTIRHWYGQPKTMKPPAAGIISNSTHYQYQFEQLSAVCVDEAGAAAGSTKMKNVTDGSCTLSSFAGYVQTTLKPTNPAGAACYLSSDMLADIKCNTAPAPNKDTDAECYNFRKNCPKFACPQHFAVDKDTMACIPLRFLAAVDTAQAIALASTNGATGLLLGICLTFIIKSLATAESKA